MSQKPRKTRRSFTQPSTSDTFENSQSNDDSRANTQPSINESLSDEQHAYHVGNVVKYILAADAFKTPILRTTISKAVNCHGKNFRAVIQTVHEVFADVFGYKLVEIENGKYILCNMLKNELPHLRFENSTEKRYALLFLTLSHIYMSGEMCTESSLVEFLTKLDIIVDGNVTHNDFGNVLELITVNFVKERYIKIDKIENDENSEIELRWGIRAHEELSVRSVMEFISKVYGDRDMKSWPQQYECMLEKEKEQEKGKEKGKEKETEKEKGKGKGKGK